MRTWSTTISGNDVFHLIYQSFFELYKGQHQLGASKRIFKDFNDVFSDAVSGNNAFFALALAQWETRTLEQWLFSEVKSIINNGDDITLWRSLGANEVVLKKRQLELEKFLSKLSVQIKNPKIRLVRNSKFARFYY